MNFYSCHHLPQDPDELPQLRRVNGSTAVSVEFIESVAVGSDFLI